MLPLNIIHSVQWLVVVDLGKWSLSAPMCGVFGELCLLCLDTVSLGGLGGIPGMFGVFGTLSCRNGWYRCGSPENGSQDTLPGPSRSSTTSLLQSVLSQDSEGVGACASGLFICPHACHHHLRRGTSD